MAIRPQSSLRKIGNPTSEFKAIGGEKRRRPERTSGPGWVARRWERAPGDQGRSDAPMMVKMDWNLDQKDAEVNIKKNK
jgi:hypothetical protein